MLSLLLKLPLFILLSLSLFLLAKIKYASYKFIEVDPSGEAKCLNGSNYGIFYSKGQSNKYLLYFDGGSWCGGTVSEVTERKTGMKTEWANTPQDVVKECSIRKNSLYGYVFLYSLFFEENPIFDYSIMRKNKEINPEFHDYNIIFMPYCDGMGHQGYQKDPLVHNGEEFYIRGEKNVKSSIEYALSNLGLKNAEEVVILGFSAGGVAAIQYSDYIQETMRNFNVSNVKMIVDSSLFLGGFANLQTKTETYKVMMENLIQVANVERPIVHTKCLQKYQQKQELYKCFMSEYLLEFVDMPTFLFMSSYDSWVGDSQLGLNCVSIGDMGGCSGQEKSLMDNNKNKVIDITRQYLNKNKNWGAFVIPCSEHGFTTYKRTFNNDNIKVGNQTAFQTLQYWMQNPIQSEKTVKIDDRNWPENTGCHELNNN